MLKCEINTEKDAPRTHNKQIKVRWLSYYRRSRSMQMKWFPGRLCAYGSYILWVLIKYIPIRVMLQQQPIQMCAVEKSDGANESQMYSNYQLDGRHYKSLQVFCFMHIMC